MNGSSGRSAPPSGCSSRAGLWSRGVLTLLALLGAGCGGGGGGSSAGGDNEGCGSWPAFYSLDDTRGNSAALAIAVIDKCNIAIAGYERSTAQGQVSGDSSGFVRLLQLTPAGIRSVWHYPLDTEGSDAVNSLELQGDNLVFTAYVSGALPGEISSGKKDVVLGRLTREGRALALSQLGNERPNVPLRLLHAPGGETLLVGNDEVFVPSNFVERWEDPWIAGVTASQESFMLDWLSNADTEVPDQFTAALYFGNTLILGRNSGGGSAQGARLEARTLTGDLYWARTISAMPYDNIADLRIGPDGTLVVLGSTYLQLGEAQLGGADYFLLQVDPASGVLTHADQFGSAGLDWARVLLLDGQRRIVLGEESNGASPWSMVITVLAADGSVLSRQSKTYGTSTQVADAAQLGQGVLAVGSYQSSAVRETGFVAFASF